MLSLRSCIKHLSVCAVVAVAVFACQSTRPQNLQPIKNLPDIVYPLAELNKNPESLDAAFNQILGGQTAIIKIDKGYIFPLIFELENRAAEIDLNNNTIELSLKHDIFLSISKKTTKWSKDGRNWYDIKNLKALKHLLACKKGRLTFSLSTNSGDSVAILMTISTDAKTQPN